MSLVILSIFSCCLRISFSASLIIASCFASESRMSTISFDAESNPASPPASLPLLRRNSHPALAQWVCLLTADHVAKNLSPSSLPQWPIALRCFHPSRNPVI